MNDIHIKADDFSNLSEDEITKKLVSIIENNEPINTSSSDNTSLTLGQVDKNNSQKKYKYCNRIKSEDNNCRKLYKYYSLDGGMSAIFNETLFFNYPSLFNDLFECRFTANHSDLINNNGQHVVVPYNLSDNFTILCLTSSPDNFQMWTFYANSFDGFVVEYEIPDNIPETLMVDVNYYNESQYEDVLKNYRNYFADLTNNKKVVSAKNLIQLMVGNKHEVWEYEHETRLVRFVSKNILDCVNNHSIVSRDLHNDIDKSLRLVKCSDLGIRITRIFLGYRFIEKYQNEWDLLLSSDESQFIDYHSDRYKHVRFLRFLLKKYGNDKILMSTPVQKDSKVESKPLNISLYKYPDFLVKRLF